MEEMDLIESLEAVGFEPVVVDGESFQMEDRHLDSGFEDARELGHYGDMDSTEDY